MTKDVLLTGGAGFVGLRINGARRYLHNITNSLDLIEQSKGIKGIVHLAAKSNRRKCENDPNGCIASNIIGLNNILNVALSRGAWVIFISTFQVKEKHLYGISKLFGEELCRVYQKKGLKVRIIRLPIIYGKYDAADKIVNKIISEIKAGVEPTVNTEDKFDFMYIDDCVNMIEHHVDVMQGGKGFQYSVRDLIAGIRTVLDEKT